MRLAEKGITISDGYQNIFGNREVPVIKSRVISQIKQQGLERLKMIEKIYIQKQLSTPILKIEMSLIFRRRKELVN